MKKYTYKLFKDGERETVSVTANTLDEANAALYDMGYSLRVGHWLIDNMVIDPGGKR